MQQHKPTALRQMNPATRSVGRGGWLVPSLVAGVVGAMLVLVLNGTQPSATAQARAGAPTASVAVVELNRILESLDERRDRANDLSALETEQRRRIEALESQLKDLNDEIEVLTRGSTERRLKTEEFARLRVRIETEVRFAQALVDDRTRMIFGELFEKIASAVAEYAQREGIQLVISSDRSVQIPQGMSLQQTDLFISNRRVLHAADGIDISQQVAAMMNNRYRMRNTNP